MSNTSTIKNTSTPGSDDSVDSSSSSSSLSSTWALFSAAWAAIRPLLPSVPLAVILVVLIGATQLALSLSIWTLLFRTGQTNAVVFAQDAQREVLSKAVAELQVRIDAAERLVRMQRAEWHQGVLNVTTPEAKDHTMRHLLDTLVMYRDMVAAYYYTTWPAGRINGWYTAQNTDSGEFEYQIWETTDVGDYRIQAVDPETMRAYGDVLLEEVDYSVADSIWVTQVLPARPRAPPSWTRAYGFEGGLWLSLSQAALAGPQGEFNAVASVDFDLTFMSNLLQGFLARNPNNWSTASSNMTLYLFEAATDTVIGSSLPTNVVLTLDIDGNERTIGINELAMIDPRMAGVTDFLRAQNSRLGARSAWSFRIDGHFVETHTVTSSYPTSNLRWVLVQLVPDDLVDKQIQQNFELTTATAGSIVALAFIVGGMCSYTMYRQMAGVARDLRLLAELDFAALSRVCDDGGARSGSLVKEIWMVQRTTTNLVFSLMGSLASTIDSVGQRERQRSRRKGSEDSGNRGETRGSWEQT